MFKKRPFTLKQSGQLFRPVGLVAREQNHVVRTRHCIDAVDLNEAKRSYYLQDAIVRQFGARWRTQTVALQKNMPRVLIGYNW